MAIPVDYVYKDGAYWSVDGSGPWGFDIAGLRFMCGPVINNVALGVECIYKDGAFWLPDSTGPFSAAI